MAKTFIFDVFLAAIIPALLPLGDCDYGALESRRPVTERLPIRERLKAVRRATPALLLIFVIFAGLYSGVFTLNEAASVAVVVSFAFAWIRGGLSLKNIVESLQDTAIIVGMLYFILIGSAIFTYFISLARTPEILVQCVGSANLPPLGIILLMLGAYLVLGPIFDELAAMIVTLPFALPIIVHLGYDPIW